VAISVRPPWAENCLISWVVIYLRKTTRDQLIYFYYFFFYSRKTEFSSLTQVLRDKRVPVTTAWQVLRLQTEERPQM
jgi:hypothetical protein